MNNKRLRGFNLVEIAIVLAIVGLVIGGIWLTAADVRNRTLYTSYTSEIAELIDYVNKNLPRQSGYTNIQTYVDNMNLTPPLARYDIETQVDNCAPPDDSDFCIYVGNILNRPISQTQCIYVGNALRSVINGNPNMMLEVDTLDDGGGFSPWWTRNGGYVTDVPYCGLNILPFKGGPHHDTYIRIRF